MNKIKKSVVEQMGSVKADISAEFRADCEDITEKFDQVSERISVSSSSTNNCKNIALNIVIRNMPEQVNENTKDKVNKLIKDGLKVVDVECDHAIRKGQNSNSNRVIVAGFTCSEDKRKVMVGKNKLKHSDQYKTVYLHHDQSVTERVMAENFRTVLHSLKQHGLVMRGQHVVQKDNRDGQAGFRQRQDPRSDQRQDGGRSQNRGNSVNSRVSNMPRDSNRGSSYAHQSSTDGHGNSHGGSLSDHQQVRDNMWSDPRRGSPNAQAQARENVPRDSHRGSPNTSRSNDNVHRDSHRGRPESDENRDWQQTNSSRPHYARGRGNSSYRGRGNNQRRNF